MLLLPLGVLSMPVPACGTENLSQDRHASEKIFPNTVEFEVLTTTDVGYVMKGQEVPDHQILPISGAQHFQAFLPLVFLSYFGASNRGGGDLIRVS